MPPVITGYERPITIKAGQVGSAATLLRLGCMRTVTRWTGARARARTIARDDTSLIEMSAYALPLSFVKSGPTTRRIVILLSLFLSCPSSASVALFFPFFSLSFLSPPFFPLFSQSAIVYESVNTRG